MATRRSGAIKPHGDFRTMTEFELFQALRPLYPPLEYALLPQVANRTGAGVDRHCDALALSLWPSRGLHLSGFELKSFRGDWLRELRDPEKAEEIAQYCNYWWIVAAGPFVAPNEVPRLWGLLVWDQKKGRLTKLRAAPFRAAIKPDLPFLAGILRKAQEVLTPAAAISEARSAGYQEGLKDGKAHGDYNARDLADLQATVRDFEKASGINIKDSWHGAKSIGEAVHQVLNGTAALERNALIRSARTILKELEPESEPAADAAAADAAATPEDLKAGTK